MVRVGYTSVIAARTAGAAWELSLRELTRITYRHIQNGKVLDRIRKQRKVV